MRDPALWARGRRLPGAGRRPGADDPAPLNPWLEEHLARLAAEGGGTVLDVGCGRGFWLRRMARAGIGAVGVEYDAGRAAEAAGQAPVAAGDACHLPFAEGSVALVWSVHVLHHLRDPEAALAEVGRVLRPGGHLVLAETVEDHPLVRLGRRARPHWDGVGVHARFGAAGLLAMVKAAGLTVVDSRQHSLVSFAAWALPLGDRRAWTTLSRWESRLPAWTGRWGAHLECVARAE